MSSTTTSLLSKRRFLTIFICQFLSAFSDNFVRTAFTTLVTYYIAEISEISRSILITLSMALFVLPFCIFSASGGKLADKFRKSRLIVWLKAINIIVALIAVIGFLTGSYFILLFSIFLTGVEAALFGPVKYSILPEGLKKSELILGNGLIEAATFVAILFGVTFGGLFVSHDSFDVYLICFIILAAAVISYVFALFIPNSTVSDPSIKLSVNLFLETKECITFTRKHRRAFLAILGISWFWLIGSVLISQMSNLTKEVFGGDESVFTLLLAAFSFGTGVGSMLCNKLLKEEITTKYVPTSMMVMSFFFLDLWWTSTIFEKKDYLGGIHYFLSNVDGIRAFIDIFMISVSGGIYIVPLYALLQLEIKKEFRSRAIAASNIMSSFFMVVASSITMALIAIGLSEPQLLFILAVANFFTASYICQILPDTVIKNFFQMALKLIYRVEIEGMENYHKAGKRVLIIANHASFIDPILIGALLPDRLIFAIDTYIARKWWLKPFLTFLRAFPVDPSNPMATKTLIDKLKSNTPVVIFPEGRITVTGSLMKIYEGPGMIADKADAVLLPIRLDGPQYSVFSRMHGKLRLRLFPKIRMHILKPQKLSAAHDLMGRDRRHEIGNMLYDIMTEMMFSGTKNTQTLFESFVHAKEQFGGNTTIIQDANKNSLTYNKICAGSFILGKRIAARTNYRDYVGFLLPNAAGTVVAFFATILYGRVPAMLNFSTGLKNLISSCKTAKIKIIYTSRVFIEKASLEHMIEEINQHDIEIVYLEDLRKEIKFYNKFKGILKSLFPLYYYQHYFTKKKYKKLPHANDPAVVLFTSGSEGLPKGVVLSHSNIIANLKQLSSRIDFTSSDKLFSALPIFHSFGLTAGMILPLLYGISTYFYPSPLHYRIIPEMVYGVNATFFFATDTFLAGYAKYAHPYDFFSIRYVFAGAEKLKEETRKIWQEKFGIRVLEGYGATETAPAISVNSPMHYKPGTVGRILPNINYKLEAVEGINEGGKLIVNGPNVMLGYLRPEKPGIIQKPAHVTQDETYEGWYDTGDIVSVDEDKYITILGRAKRFAKIGGEMVSLAAIEEAVTKLWPENLHGTLSVDDPKKGESIILFTDKEGAAKEDIIRFLNKEGYSELYIPKSVIYIEEMPLLGAGKIDYMSLKEKLKNM
ncbi:acyl-[ACP]--phospholipid O-acyltransferase [endosymbiont of Acanthamoeba sp. UWC8]|uniref:acyl-[ACP]--phospholipid O-acyltransferase n=1 Tax=endosymbiont of Acanthamoeba sp. UWC8 TaxID=86106 RepID=UPI00056F3D4E|nr:acyl-[ACP]--phospholipid O-acyltransferase [endosymbiont of Acanthamoeba sp. UWC8]